MIISSAMLSTKIDFSMPEDGYRMANFSVASCGEIRFAGFSTDPFEIATALTLLFRNQAQVGPETLLSVDLDVLGDTESQVVPERMIHAPERQMTKVVHP